MIGHSRLSMSFFGRAHLIQTILMALALAASEPTGFSFDQTTVVLAQGAPTGPGVRSRVYCSGRKLRLEPGGAPDSPALILRLDLGRAWRLDPEARRAVEIDAERLRARSQSDASVAAGLMGGLEDVRTRPLDARRTIAGLACRGFRITGPSVTMEVWVAEALPLRADAFADFLEWSGAAQALGGLLAEIRRLPGFPLETRAKVSVLDQVQDTVSTITAIHVGAPPPALFEVPAGWRVVSEPR